MKIPLELQVQKSVEDWLCKKDLYPFSVLYISATRKRSDILKISFILELEISSFLDRIGYDSLADKSGVIVYKDTFTVLLTGLNLRLFFKLIENEA